MAPVDGGQQRLGTDIIEAENCRAAKKRAATGARHNEAGSRDKRPALVSSHRVATYDDAHEWPYHMKEQYGMAFYLPSSGSTWNGDAPANLATPAATSDIADLKIFWGPDMCRLEYLVHLLETGRIKDERRRSEPGERLDAASR